MSESRCVSFPNQAGLMLHGLLHEPDTTDARGVCILLLSPGTKGRVGPHRLYLKLATRFVRLGFHVLRFDYHGLGDAEGELPERALADMYNSIQSGRYVGDTIAAMDWLQRTANIRRFVGSGLCGGSISALLTAEADPRIECLLGIGLPTVLDGGPDNWARVITQHEVESLRGAYFGKLSDPRAWARLVSGKSSYRVIWRVIQSRFTPSRVKVGIDGGNSRPKVDNTNPRFASAFLSMLDSGRPLMLFFSGADRLRAQLAENFEAHYEARLQQHQNLYSVHVIPGANHVMSNASWVAQLSDAAADWLVSRYPKPVAANPRS